MRKIQEKEGEKKTVRHVVLIAMPRHLWKTILTLDFHLIHMDRLIKHAHIAMS